MHRKEDRTCYLCIRLHDDYSTQTNLQEHHVAFGWFGAGRRLSEKFGLKVYLCDGHHEHSREAVHVNEEIRQMLCEDAQRAFEAHYPNLSFKDIFGINYINHESDIGNNITVEQGFFWIGGDDEEDSVKLPWMH